MIGRTLDHYRIESKLGEGGMGLVYAARDLQLGRRVAIKVLPPEKTAHPENRAELWARFVREAKAASALDHPGIVTVHDIRSEHGVDFIVMEYVEGKTLAELIGSGVRVAEALKYAAQIAGALARAHSAGIVHRDLKPSNIMVTPEGRTKILDFGVAKLLDPSQVGAAGDATVTGVDVVPGTTRYMSPEQLEGRAVDARSDVFSFGTVLYEMLTGRHPFAANSGVAAMVRIVSDEPTPPGRLATIPPELEKLVLRCLRKDPARRFQTMADLSVALEDLLPEAGATRRPAVMTSGRRWVWAVPALLAFAYAVWRLWPAAEPAGPPLATPLTVLPGLQRYPSFSPDGRFVTFMWTGPAQDNPDIYVQTVGSGSPLRVTTDSANDYDPAWSPDGRWIAFLRRRWEAGTSELRLIAPLGGPERRLADIRVAESFAWPPYLAWCPDSDCLIVTDTPAEDEPAALFAVSLTSGRKTRLTKPSFPATGDTNPAVSPDGEWLVFRRNASAVGTGELHLLKLRRRASPGDADSVAPFVEGEPRRLTTAGLDAEYPAWMPDSRSIVFSSARNLWRLPVTGERSGGSLPARLPFVGENGIMPAVSRAEPGQPIRLVYVRSFENYNTWRVRTDAPGASAASPPALAIASTRRDYHQQFSPDGRRVAFCSERSGEPELWVADPDGANPVQLTSKVTGAGYPRWSPDGTQLVFTSSLEGQWDLWLIPASGGAPRRLTSHPAADVWPSFSRDGQWIYFTSNRTGEWRIWKMPAAGGDATQVTDGVAYQPFESPDGRYVYYVETRDRPSPLWRVPVAGGAPERVLDGVVLFNFVVLDRGIYYIDRPSGEGGIREIDRPSGETRLRYFDLETRSSTTVARDLGNVFIGLTVSPDGRTILYSRVDSSVDDLILVENFR